MYLQEKRFGRVCMNKKWGSHEGNLQRLEGNFNFWVSMKKVDPSELNE